MYRETSQIPFCLLWMYDWGASLCFQILRSKELSSSNVSFLEFQLWLIWQTCSAHSFAIAWVSLQKFLWDGCIIPENGKKNQSKKRSMTSSLLLSKDLEFEREALMGYKMCLLPCLWMSVLIALNYKLLKIAAYSYTEEAYYFVSIFWK